MDIALGIESICKAATRVSLRRALASVLVASLRAIPICPCASAATCSASRGSMPSRATSRSATVCVDGCLSATRLTRERIVGSMSASLGAQSSQIVPAGGSSRAFSNTFEERSAIRSASSMIMIWYLLSDPPKCDAETSCLISSMEMMTFSVAKTETSG